MNKNRPCQVAKGTSSRKDQENFNLQTGGLLDSQQAHRSPHCHRRGRPALLLTCLQWEPYSARGIRRPEMRARSPENMRDDTPSNLPSPMAVTMIKTVPRLSRKTHGFQSARAPNSISWTRTNTQIKKACQSLHPCLRVDKELFQVIIALPVDCFPARDVAFRVFIPPEEPY